MTEMRPVIGITMGDPAGVGPELCLRAMADPMVLDNCVPVLFGDPRVLDLVAEATGLSPIPDVVPPADWPPSSLPGPLGVACGRVGSRGFEPGKVNPDCGKASYIYVRDAIQSVQDGHTSAIVTAPINKESLSLAGIPYPGHTEILAESAGTERYCMMLTSDTITVSLVTTHVALDEVASRLSVQRIVDVIDLTAAAMRRLLGHEPRLVVCGLNPHAGEHGLFGSEESDLIAPAIAEAAAAGISVEGPLPPDTAFIPGRLRVTDAFVCMYHDQGLIPFKLLAFEAGVNVTLGLPFIRTSVDHGTAFDIAWQGKAEATSMVNAILLAVRLQE